MSLPTTNPGVQTALNDLVHTVVTKLGLNPNNHIHANATPSKAGFLSASDKAKLDGLGGGGSYVLPLASADTLGGVKEGNGIVIDADGLVNAKFGTAVNTVAMGNHTHDYAAVSLSSFSNDAGYQTATQVNSALTTLNENVSSSFVSIAEIISLAAMDL